MVGGEEGIMLTGVGNYDDNLKVELSLKENAPADLVLAYFCGEPLPNHVFLRGLEHFAQEMNKDMSMSDSYLSNYPLVPEIQ